MEQTPAVRQIALIDCFAKATWIALGFALMCLSVDGYAIFGLPHHSVQAGRTQGLTFPIALWSLEIVLALLALWLVRFAFSRPPNFPGEGKVA